MDGFFLVTLPYLVSPDLGGQHHRPPFPSLYVCKAYIFLSSFCLKSPSQEELHWPRALPADIVDSLSLFLVLIIYNCLTFL